MLSSTFALGLPCNHKSFGNDDANMINTKYHLWLAETLVPSAGPLALRQGELLLAAVEAFGRVEEEVSLRDLGRQIEKLLQRHELSPGLLDEFVAIDDVDLGERKVSHPPHQVIMVDTPLQRLVANVNVAIFREEEIL